MLNLYISLFYIAFPIYYFGPILGIDINGWWPMCYCYCHCHEFKGNSHLIASSATVEIAPIATKFSWPGLKTNPCKCSEVRTQKQQNTDVLKIKTKLFNKSSKPHLFKQGRKLWSGVDNWHEPLKVILGNIIFNGRQHLITGITRILKIFDHYKVWINISIKSHLDGAGRQDIGMRINDQRQTPVFPWTEEWLNM